MLAMDLDAAITHKHFGTFEENTCESLKSIKYLIESLDKMFYFTIYFIDINSSYKSEQSIRWILLSYKTVFSPN